MAQVEYGGSVYENVSGQFRPDLVTAYEIPYLKDAKSSPGPEITPDQYHIAAFIAQKFRAHFGGEKKGIPELNPASLLPANMIESLGIVGLTLPGSGYMLIDTSFLKTLDSFAQVLGHEYLHFISYRTVKNGITRRIGISQAISNSNTNPLHIDKHISQVGLSEIGEGVNEKTNRDLFAQYFPDVNLNDSNYSFQIDSVKTVCRTISEAKPNLYPTPNHVFELFKKAHFEGRILPMAFAMEAVYGRGSYSKLIDLFAEIPTPKLGLTVDPKQYQNAPLIYDVLTGRMTFEEYEAQKKR